MFLIENHLNNVKLVKSGSNTFLALKLALFETIIHLLCDCIQFNLLMINDILFTLCSIYSDIISLLCSQVINITDFKSKLIYIYINNTCVSNVVECMVAHADKIFLILTLILDINLAIRKIILIWYNC